jgi:hypothetical protein
LHGPRALRFCPPIEKDVPNAIQPSLLVVMSWSIPVATVECVKNLFSG